MFPRLGQSHWHWKIFSITRIIDLFNYHSVDADEEWCYYNTETIVAWGKFTGRPGISWSLTHWNMYEERHLTPHLIRLSSRPTWLDRPVLAAGLSHSSPSEPSMTMAFHAARLVRKRKSVGFHILEQRYHILSSGTRHSRRVLEGGV